MKYLFFVLVISLTACNAPSSADTSVDRFTHIKDKKAKEIITVSIKHAGGIEKWEAIKRLRYTKNFSLILENGTLEKEFKQVHDYQYDPLKIDIQSEENGVLIHTVFENGKYHRTKNGVAVEMSQEALAKAVNTSTYVVGMPFKLLDPEPEIKYEGKEKLTDGRIVDVLSVSYNSAEQKNHSSTELWKYYFDKNDSKIVANWVRSSDHFSFIENLTFERAGGILFNKERKSYRVDSLGNKLYLRAEYLYGDFVVE